MNANVLIEAVCVCARVIVTVMLDERYLLTFPSNRARERSAGLSRAAVRIANRAAFSAKHQTSINCLAIETPVHQQHLKTAVFITSPNTYWLQGKLGSRAKVGKEVIVSEF